MDTLTVTADLKTATVDLGIRDASHELSARILGAFFRSLDEKKATIVYDGNPYYFVDQSQKKVMSGFGVVTYLCSRSQRH